MHYMLSNYSPSFHVGIRHIFLHGWLHLRSRKLYSKAPLRTHTEVSQQTGVGWGYLKVAKLERKVEISPCMCKGLKYNPWKGM